MKYYLTKFLLLIAAVFMAMVTWYTAENYLPRRRLVMGRSDKKGNL